MHDYGTDRLCCQRTQLAHPLTSASSLSHKAAKALAEPECYQSCCAISSTVRSDTPME